MTLRATVEVFDPCLHTGMKILVLLEWRNHEDEIGVAGSTHESKACFKEKMVGKKPLGRYRSRCEDGIKMKQDVSVWT
jgi:hypothetical protein